MFLLGGVCFVVIGKLSRAMEKVPLALQLILFSGVITLLELFTGLAVNGNYRVWDYRQVPYNFLGQICLPFSLLWIPVSLAARQLFRLADKGLASRSFAKD